MGLKPGYKQSEVGEIPDDWEVGNLFRFWNVTDCKHVTAEFVSNGFPVASIKEVQSRFVDLTNAKQTTTHFYDLLIEGGRKPGSGDLMLSRNATVGEIAQVADWHPRFAMGQDVCLLRKKSPEYSTEFLQAVFQSPVIGKQLSNLKVGSTFKRVNVAQIRNFSVPMPSPREQRAIAEALSDVDALIGTLDRLIAKKRDLKQAAMQQLLTGQKRLPGFSGEWETGHLRSFVQNHNAGVYKNIKSYGKGCNIIGVSDLYGIDCVDGQSFAQVPVSPVEQAKYTLKTNDLVYGESSLVREGIARTVYVTERGAGTAFAWHTRRYSVDQNVLLSSYLYYYLQSRFARKHMMDQSIQTAITGINTAAYFGCPVFIPPLAEQTAIAEVLSDMDAEIAALERRHDKTRVLKQGMMQELLTGRTRLV
jgi:type I restriction enzyme S subunit